MLPEKLSVEELNLGTGFGYCLGPCVVSAFAGPMASTADNPLMSAPAVNDLSQSTSDAEASAAIPAAPMSNEQRDPVHPVPPLPRQDSMSAAPSASLGGDPRPTSGGPSQSGSSGSAASRGRALITVPSKHPHPSSQPNKRSTDTQKTRSTRLSL